MQAIPKLEKQFSFPNPHVEYLDEKRNYTYMKAWNEST